MRHKKSITRRFGLNFILEGEIKQNCLFKSGVLTRYSNFWTMEIQNINQIWFCVMLHSFIFQDVSCQSLKLYKLGVITQFLCNYKLSYCCQYFTICQGHYHKYFKSRIVKGNMLNATVCKIFIVFVKCALSFTQVLWVKGIVELNFRNYNLQLYGLNKFINI